MAILEGYNLERTEDEEEIEYADLHFNRSYCSARLAGGFSSLQVTWMI